MIRVELPALIGRFNDISREGLEASAALCISRQGAEITPAHLLFKLLETPLCDVRCILDSANIDHLALQPLLGASLEGGPQTAAAYPSFSPLLVEMLQDAWLLASAELGHQELRSGAIFLTLLLNADRYLMPQVARELKTINREHLRNQFDRVTRGSAETPVADDHDGQPAGNQGGDSDMLARYATDFTKLAREDKLDPVLCRDTEIDQMIDILCRRRKNNPIAVGDAGVGKSAVVEGLALRIVAGDVPARLHGVELWALDLGALQAGASVKGEFEKRLKGLIEAVKAAATPVILFIDEAHTLIGAGNSEGGSDAANLLKPALARGELRTVAATTWREYKKYFEKDPALSRRFQPVALGEPTPAQAVHILRGLRPVYEKAHQVLIDNSALTAAAEMSARYLAGRQLPDKAIDVLDTAAARVSLNLSSPPRRLSHVRSELHQLQMEQDLISRQDRLGQVADGDRRQAVNDQIDQLQSEADALEERWHTQRELVAKLVGTREQLLTAQDDLSDSEAGPVDPETLRQEAGALAQELEQLQADEPLVHAMVDTRQVAEVIADWTGIPVNRMTTDELQKITHLPEHMQAHIKGQEPAIQALHQHLLTARADLRRPGRPMGAFLLVGPSGVGKTETVVQLSELLYGGRQFLTSINMSEYQEKHTVSRLIGSPPGYVGFGEGGILTEAIRQKPYSIVLLDEVEKAHPEVLNLFYQAFDKGELADGEGRLIDCRNVVFFLTSNLGYQTIVQHADKGGDFDASALDDALYPELADFFKPALLARMEVVPYLPLDENTLNRIVADKLERLGDQIRERYQTDVELDDGLITAIRSRATRSENGARMLESIIEGELLPPVSLALLEKLAAREPVAKVTLGVSEGRFTGMVV